MPAREEEGHEGSVFVEPVAGAEEVTNGYSDTRDMTPAGIAAREPFESERADAQEQRMEVKEEDAEVSIDDVVSRIIIHDDRPIENLPVMQAPELKLIGRCVSLCVSRNVNDIEQIFYYTGLVSSVTYTAVTLMHVNRYTRSDFKKYVTREKQVTKDGVQADKESGGSAGKRSGLPSHGYTVEGEVGVGKDGGLTSTQDAAALLRLDAAGSLAPAVALCTKEEIEALDFAGSPNQPDAPEAPQTQSTTRALQHKNFRRCEASIGPLPYVTFLRKSVHDVRFGRDPRSSFYALFSDPTKAITDTQFLRMFVRRYLVHTSEGNNPRQVPLYAFVSVRCGCPNMDGELVNRVAREELPGLLRSDKSIEKEKTRQRSREVRQEQAIQTFRAPNGLFAHTGILYLTRLPQVTFLTAVLILLFTVVFAVYLGVSMGVMSDSLITTYERNLLGFFVPSILVWAIAGVLTVLHSLYVRVPLHTSFLTMILRSIWSIGGFACAVMVLAVIAERLRDKKMINFMNSASSPDLCTFYKKYECSGFWTACFEGSIARMCNLDCAPWGGSNFTEPCYPYVWNRVQLQLIPLVVFAAMLIFVFAYSVYLLWKLWSTVNHISSRVQ